MSEFKMRHLHWFFRVLLMWIVESITLAILLLILPTITLADWLPVLLTSLLIGLLNALIRPLLVALSIPPTTWIYAGLTFLLDILLLWIAAHYLFVLPPLTIWAALLIPLAMALFTNSFGDLLAIDDDDSYYHHIVSNIVKIYGQP